VAGGQSGRDQTDLTRIKQRF